MEANNASSNTSAAAAAAASSRAEAVRAVTVLLWQTLPPVLLLLGSLGNVMTVVVMRGMRASSSSPSTACLSLYFTALALSDQCLLVVGVVWFGVEVVFTWPPSYFRHDLMCSVPWFAVYTGSWTSAWFLVTMTYQRVTSVVLPHRVGVLCTVRRGKGIIATIVVVIVAINCHLLFTFAYQRDVHVCSYQERYEAFIYVYTWIDLFGASVIPFVLLIVGNSVLVWHVVQSISFSRTMHRPKHQEAAASDTHNKAYSMTVTLILTSAVFLILTLPVCALHTYKRTLNFDTLDDEYLAVLNLAESICLLLWAGASSSNFYLYFLSGRKFRQETKRHLCCFSKQKMGAS